MADQPENSAMISCDAPSLRESPAFGPFCPACGCDLDGGEIPENIREYYSPPYRWQRIIGISDGDSIYAWLCPDCKHEWLPDGERSSARAARAGWVAPGNRKDGSSQKPPSPESAD